MKFTPLIHKAIDVSAKLHKNQIRKISGIPFIVHPFGVALIVSEYTDDENVIAAGLLHDVLEDVDEYSDKEMIRDFGYKVYKIVKELTEDRDPPNSKANPKDSWDFRKKHYLSALKDDSLEALLVCCADKLHNLTCLLNEYELYGNNVFNKFNATKEQTLWFYSEALQILKSKLKSPIIDEYEKLFNKANKIIK